MKDKKEKEPDTKVLELEVSPEQGAAMVCLNCCPKGYKFVSMKRNGTQVKATYRKKERDE